MEKWIGAEIREEVILLHEFHRKTPAVYRQYWMLPLILQIAICTRACFVLW